MQRGLIAEHSRQHGVAAARPSPKGGECATYRLAEATTDTDTVPVRRRITVRTGHFLTTHGGDPPAGGCTVVGTCMGASS